MEISEIKRILVPTDYSEDSAKALPYALSIHHRFDAKIFLLHVIEDLKGIAGFYVPHVSTEILEKEMEAEARRMLTAFGRKYLKGFKDFEEILLRGMPDEEIVKFAASNGIDMIVMSSHGRTGIDRWVLGSTVERVLKNTPCPVLLVPVKEV